MTRAMLVSRYLPDYSFVSVGSIPFFLVFCSRIPLRQGKYNFADPTRRHSKAKTGAVPIEAFLRTGKHILISDWSD